MGFRSVAQLAQNKMAKIACNDLGFKETALYFYDSKGETTKERNIRFDGILASLQYSDTMIFQSPSWNAIEWDQEFLDKVSLFQGVKKIIFIEDVVPLMFKSNRYLLPKFVHYYNQADVLICPSRQMYDFLRKQGLQEKQIVVQGMWDHVCQVDLSFKPQNNKVINFAGDPQKFDFVQRWNNKEVKLNIYGSKPAKANPQVTYKGWLNDPELLKDLRKSGGFGLVWSEEPYWCNYMKLNASYKLSTYLAAGIPIIANSATPSKKIILQNHLGIIADSLAEAADKVKTISDAEYGQMINSVDSFAKLLRNGYFTKRALINAVFRTRCND